MTQSCETCKQAMARSTAPGFIEPACRLDRPEFDYPDGGNDCEAWSGTTWDKMLESGGWVEIWKGGSDD